MMKYQKKDSYTRENVVTYTRKFTILEIKYPIAQAECNYNKLPRQNYQKEG